MNLKNKFFIVSLIVTFIVGVSFLSSCSFITPSDNSKTEANNDATEIDNSGKSKTTYLIEYYIDEKTDIPSDKVTTVVYGQSVPVLTIKELGFSKEGKAFKGWKVYRDVDNTWSLRTIEDKKQKWVKLENNKLPEGYEFKLHGDGSPSVKATKNGVIKLYGVWED